MFSKLRLWANILIGMGFAILVAMVTLTLINLRNLESVIEAGEEAELRRIANTIQVNIAAETETAQALSALVANMPEVQTRFAAGDRAWLRDQLLPAYRVLEANHAVVQFQFHHPPARSFLRLHLPDKHGDDLAAFRHTVVATNTELAPHRGLEIGVGDLGARGMVPVFDEGQHIGSVEFGLSFGQSFFDAFKRDYGVDAGLHLFRNDRIETFAGTYGEQPLSGAADLEAAFSGQPRTTRLMLDGVPFAVYAEAVLDYSGRPLGVIEVAMDRRDHLANLARATRTSWLVGLLAVLLGLAVSWFMARALTRRIARLGDGVRQVAAGNLAGAIPIAGRDELASLAVSIEQMREHLHDLVAEVDANAREVHVAAEEIAHSVDGQAANSSEMSASVAEITSTMEELSASSIQIAEYSGTVVEIAKRTYDDSLQGAEAMQRLTTRMTEIHDRNQDSLREIIDLGRKSKEISRIMVIIDTVADQTKLIAFNAALEASSAGEAGRRFGVVAAEIRRLADSVSESTNEIETKVAEIQEAINRLVITSEKGAVGIEQGMEETAQTASFLETLVEAASESSRSAQQINLSTQQQRTASNQVVIALREIVAASADTAQTVQRIAQVTQQMTRSSALLRKQVATFTLARAEPSPDSKKPTRI
ncbi:methyl-accepting chemotaxis protein [Thioalkalicoccus limnaeus]|uniref:Methyl-accepting chemotaxis protein n=1 Tax=Thioalkalicoccus limnaeus TaxID=120681 RepID=A0ABV4BG67_9GAMM